MHERPSSAPTYPDAVRVGPHLVVDKTEWVPGANPEPHLREDRQTTYPETYLYCLRCSAEAMRERDLPATCDAPAPLDAPSAADSTDDGEGRDDDHRVAGDRPRSPVDGSDRDRLSPRP